MAVTSVPTFEEVDKHIQAADLSVFMPGGTHHVTSASAAYPAAVLPNVCVAYKVIRPILMLASNTPLIPQKWRDAIKGFVGVMDAICP